MIAVKVVLLLLLVGFVVVHPSQGQLTITKDGTTSVMNNTNIEVANAQFGVLNLDCNSGSSDNVTWLVLPDNGQLLTYDGSNKGTSTYVISGSGSQVTLAIQFTITLFRGLLKCVSTSGQALSVLVVPNDFDANSVSCSEDLDFQWRLLWRETFAGRRDVQSCPTDGPPTRGYAIRRCLNNGTWEGTVDISGCSTEKFENLIPQANALMGMDRAMLSAAINSFIETQFSPAVTVKSNNNTHFPRDLSISNEVIGILLTAMRQTSGNEFPSLVGVFSNLLHPVNVEGWLQLPLSNGGVRLLEIIDEYGEYLVSIRPNTTSSQIFNSDIDPLSFATFRVVRMLSTPYSAFTYPISMDYGVQAHIPSTLLQAAQATGLVITFLPTISSILPTPDLNTSIDTRVATPVISTQIFAATGSITTFATAPITFNFKTEMLRSRNPTCVFLDPTSPTTSSNWSIAGVFTEVTGTAGAEFKEYDVQCISPHLTAFAVAVEETTSQFEITIPVYIGCAFLIISGAISLLTLLLSCLLDGFRKYFLSGYLIHMSFAFSVLSAAIVFLAGITMGLSSKANCEVVSGILLYFFTASFSWLLCEMMLVVCFGVISRNWCLVILILVTGWGLPGISTGVTAGLLHTEFGSTAQCWVFFDGNISSSVFLGFLVPKLALVGMCIFLLSVSCCTTYRLTYEKIQPFLKKYIVRLLWFIWVSTIILVALLSISWVFLLLFVNAFATDLSLSQWIFMGASIALGIWMFIFNAVVVIVSQKVDYERLWSKKETVYVEADPGKGSGYEFMNMSSAVDLSGRRSNRNSIVVGPPSSFPTDNPVFA